MRKTLSLSIGAFLLLGIPMFCNAQVDTKWKIHDPERPLPPVVDAGTSSTQDSPGRAPSDAVVLFDGKDLSKWAHKDGSAAKRSEEHTSELQSLAYLVCRLLLEKKKKKFDDTRAACQN